MAYEDRPGSGAIFKNSKLKDTHPDYKGNIITPSGEKLDISLWVKTAKSGKKYFSVSVQDPVKKDAAPNPTPTPTPAPEQRKEEPDDLPF